MKTEIFKTEYLDRLIEAKELINITNKASVLIIQQIPLKDKTEPLLPHIRESISNIICFVEIGDSSLVDFILDNAQGIIDKIIVDADLKRENSSAIIDEILNKKQIIPIAFYSDFDMWGDASINFILQIEQYLYNKRLLLLGNTYLTTRLLLNFLNKGIEVSMFEKDYNNGLFNFNSKYSIQIKSDLIKWVDEKIDEQYDILIGSSVMSPYKYENKLSNKKFVNIYDIGLHNFSKTFVTINLEKRANIYRFDNRAGISSVVLNIMETAYLINNNLGEVSINNIRVVSGGQMGSEGSIVVDNAFNPHLILGVADGEGMFKAELNELDKKNIQIIKSLLNK